MRSRGIRVIAGSARGRRLVVPPGPDVRPTKDMVREAVFSALSARGAVVGSRVLDLYAGSGALGIEALSRGADRAVFVESEPAAIAAIEENVDALGLQDRTRVVRSDVARFVAGGGSAPADAPFRLVFADPPYLTADRDVAAVLAAFAAPGLLADDATVVVERPTGSDVVPPEGLGTVWERIFGDTLVVFLEAPS
jgi:16S rRNA (guanine966-N2)-methyltransferase